VKARAAKREARNIAGATQDTPRALGGWGFAPVKVAESEKGRREKAAKVKTKNDPKLVKAARELRDRWMEELNHSAPILRAGKYDVGRMLGAVPRREAVRILPAA
jgi:hypothetical protein